MAGRDVGLGGPQPREPEVPPSVLRSWDESEARLFPLVMAQPELYEQALGVVRELIARLRETCPDLPALLAAHERGGDLIADLDEEAAAKVPGIRPGLIAAAACAMRYRELVALMAAQTRLAALARARAQGLLVELRLGHDQREEPGFGLIPGPQHRRRHPWFSRLRAPGPGIATSHCTSRVVVFTIMNDSSSMRLTTVL